MSSDPTDSATANGWYHARTAVLGVLSAELLVLVITGVALYFVYRPTATQSWNDLLHLHSDGTLPSGVVWSNRLQFTHRLASFLAVPTAMAAAVVLVVGTQARRRRRVRVAHAVAVAALAVLASMTGYLLPWEQLGLWAVTTGSSVDGYEILFGDRVRFAIVGGVEVSPDTMARWLLVHAGFGAALVAGVAGAWRAQRRAGGAHAGGRRRQHR